VENLASPHPNAPESTGQLSAFLPTPPGRNPVLFNDRGLRAGWRLLIYILLIAISFTLIGFIARRVHTPTGGIPSPSAALLQEALAFAVVFGCALIMSRIERRSPGDYGLPIAEAFGKKFWLGILFGLVEISILMGLISTFGGYSFGSIALSTKGIVGWGLLHLVLFTVVGFFEEFLFRGLLQNMLARSTKNDRAGWWTASVLFGFSHITNMGFPNWRYVILASIAGLFYGWTWRRTGSIFASAIVHALVDAIWHFLFRTL